ncbi:MAG: 30S ribosomal protein S16 [Desulfomonilia bacterium]|jgi:small subunit ribosomal protein S16|uniref:30S ribosomal subunit protein S16 n=1 Tax=anaerobic digester metagenome TaxID=1263854 RepID=A0A485M644_9ZZZZ|nr:30S ribosomal protein S16 [Pseudomonadota bacterium]HON37701.1 30S ribosomal protein S16 [Deltaproteobacteria bacterium]HRS55204.1 30S ribosomal protein S16 [Desulfomonilia bacterium]HPD20370.1 30S ribosomal protein S16 [Deltaproteobacteria bacterium]HPX17173.1 30S ribosomal protein S16 [Deltaproteobacteria bacterium]
MAVSIRLTRGGSKKKAFYRVIVADSRSKRDGRFLEIVGHFNPKTRPESISLDMDRINEWMKKGGQLTPAVKKLMKEKGQSIESSGTK